VLYTVVTTFLDSMKNAAFNVFQFLVTVKVVPTSLRLCNLIMEAIRSSETSVLIKATRCHIQEGCILRR
jgi:hypothetical protein